MGEIRLRQITMSCYVVDVKSVNKILRESLLGIDSTEDGMYGNVDKQYSQQPFQIMFQIDFMAILDVVKENYETQ